MYRYVNIIFIQIWLFRKCNFIQILYLTIKINKNFSEKLKRKRKETKEIFFERKKKKDGEKKKEMN